MHDHLLALGTMLLALVIGGVLTSMSYVTMYEWPPIWWPLIHLTPVYVYHMTWPPKQNQDSKQTMCQKAVRDEHWQGVQDTIEQQRHNDQVWKDEQLPVPDSWQVMTNGSTTALRSLQLRMPNCRCGCPF